MPTLEDPKEGTRDTLGRKADNCAELGAPDVQTQEDYNQPDVNPTMWTSVTSRHQVNVSGQPSTRAKTSDPSHLLTRPTSQPSNPPPVAKVGTTNHDINIKTQKHNLLPGPLPSMTEWIREKSDPSPAKYHNLGGEDHSPPVTEERTTWLDFR